LRDYVAMSGKLHLATTGPISMSTHTSCAGQAFEPDDHAPSRCVAVWAGFHDAELDRLGLGAGRKTGGGVGVVPGAAVGPGGAGHDPAPVLVDGPQPRACHPPAVESDRRPRRVYIRSAWGHPRHSKRPWGWSGVGRTSPPSSPSHSNRLRGERRRRGPSVASL